MTAPDGWYWTYLSPKRRLRVSAGLAPHYVLHFTLRPYRRHVPRGSLPDPAAYLRGRHAAATLDVWIGQLLRAYPSVAGYTVRKESGSLAVHYIRLMAVLNREYEHRLATGKTLQLNQVIKDPLVALRIAEWETFASRYTKDSAIIEFMSSDDLVADYNAYIAITTRAGFTVSPVLQIESIRLDSGGYLKRLARLLDGFNERRSEPLVLEEFFQLGMVAKFADELADLATDYAEDRYNLLLALLGQHPREQAGVMMHLDRGLPIPVYRLLECAPQAFGKFSSMFEDYYKNLRPLKLRQICDMTMLRTVGGPKKRQSAKAKQHVSEPPSQPWR
jgi:hypothetical protein